MTTFLIPRNRFFFECCARTSPLIPLIRQSYQHVWCPGVCQQSHAHPSLVAQSRFPTCTERTHHGSTARRSRCECNGQNVWCSIQSVLRVSKCVDHVVDSHALGRMRVAACLYDKKRQWRSSRLHSRSRRIRYSSLQSELTPSVELNSFHHHHTLNSASSAEDVCAFTHMKPLTPLCSTRLL